MVDNDDYRLKKRFTHQDKYPEALLTHKSIILYTHRTTTKDYQPSTENKPSHHLLSRFTRRQDRCQLQYLCQYSYPCLWAIARCHEGLISPISSMTTIHHSQPQRKCALPNLARNQQPKLSPKPQFSPFQKNFAAKFASRFYSISMITRASTRMRTGLYLITISSKYALMPKQTFLAS